MDKVQPSAIRELLALGANPSIISFGGGYPDARLFPIKELDDVYHTAISNMGPESLQYTGATGLPRLRQQVADRMSRAGVPCGPENVLITQGGQQGLDLVAKLLIDPGDVILTENPTFLGALIAFNPCEPRYVGIPMDDQGMDVDALEMALGKTKRVKFLYTVPDFQNPTGVTLSLARRQRLLELASEYDFFVLEDSPYREVRFEGANIAPIKSMDTDSRVIHLGSFSKILAPGLRLGWVVASEAIVQQLGLLKLAADTQCSTLNMVAVSIYLDTYDIDRHIATLRGAYLHKKNLMLDAMRRNFPPAIHFTNPSGGMFTWVTFPEGFDAGRFMRERAIPEAKVAYVPGASFFPVHQEKNHARMSYSTASDAAIAHGIEALGRLLQVART